MVNKENISVSSAKSIQCAYLGVLRHCRAMDPPEVTNIIVSVIIVILCTFGNCLVIISLKRFEWLRVPTNYFVALLAFCDFCNGLPVYSFSTATLFLSTENDKITVKYDVICRISVYVAGLSGYGNLLCVIIITADRYIFINWPFRYYDIVTNKNL